jgi:hypothetical protein
LQFCRPDTNLSSIEKISSALPDLRDSAEELYQTLVQNLLRIDNVKKNLEVITNNRKIIQEFEKSVGFESMLKCSYVQTILQDFITEDPSFVESLLKKCWHLNNIPQFLSIILSAFLNAGHALELVDLQGMYNTRNIELMHVISKKEANALPDGSSRQVFAILLDDKMQGLSVFFQARDILTSFMQRGKDGDFILQGALTMLNSNERRIQDNGTRVRDLLLENRHHYPLDFQEKLTKAFQKQSEDLTLKIHLQEALTMLNSNVKIIQDEGKRIRDMLLENRQHYPLDFQEKLTEAFQKQSEDLTLKIHLQ